MTQSRRDKGISQSDLAKDLGIAQHQLSNWETDQHLPHWAITVRWCLSLSMAPMTIKLLDPRWITLDDAAFMALWQSTAKAVRHAEEARRRLGEAAADYPGGIDALAAVMGVSPIKLREMFDWKSFQNIQWYFDVASYLKLSSLAWLMPGFEIGDQATLLRDFQASLRSLEVRKGIKSSRILGISDSTFWHRMSQLKAGRIAIIDFFELLFSVADSIEEFVAVFPEVSNKPRTKRLRGTTAAERMLLEALEAAPPSSQQLRLVEAMENFKKSEPRNAEILRLYLGVGVHGAGMERSELAKRYGRDGKDLSKERIRQVVQSSIKKIYAEAGIMAPQNPPVPNRKSSPRRHRQNARPVREVAATA